MLLLVATMTAPPVQLDLFDPPAPLSAPTSAPVRRKGTTTRPGALRAADGAPARESVPIPARCPVTDGRACYREGCHHYRPARCGNRPNPDPERPLRCRLVVTFARPVDLVGALARPLAAGTSTVPGGAELVGHLGP